jgi:hypothetical protein
LSEEGIMYINYSVQIEEKLHQICVAVPDSYSEKELQGVLKFAVMTALLEHSGYLPAGVIHAVA